MFNFTYTSFKNFMFIDITKINTIIYIFVGIILSMPIYKKIFDKSNKNIALTIFEDITLGTCFILCIMFLVSNQYNPFIYFRF